MQEQDTLQVTDIVNHERIRKDYGDVGGLAASIKRYGVIQPIVIQRSIASSSDADGETDDTKQTLYVLVAGGRRLAALQLNGETILRHGKEFVWRDEDVRNPGTALRLQAMELEENIRRSDLSWSETILAKLRLLRTMQQIHGVSKGYGAGKSAAWDRGFGIRTLAEMLGENPGTTSRDIELAQFVETHPTLAKFANRADAIRHVGVAFSVASMMKKAAGVIGLRAPSAPSSSTTPTTLTGVTAATPGPDVGRTVGSGAGNQPCATVIPAQASVLRGPAAYSGWTDSEQPLDPRWALYEGRFQDNISVVSDASVDLICTDLPYNIGQGTSAASHSGGLAQFDDTDLDITGLCTDTALATFRVLRHNRFAVFFYGMNYHEILRTALHNAGFTVDPYPFIWLRDRTAPPDGFARYSKTYDPAMVASKGTPRFIRPNLPNSVAIPSVRGPERLHSAQKPVELMRKFIEDMTLPDCVVLDPFAGAGTTGVAAVTAKRRCIMFELEPNNCLIIKSRMDVL